MTLGFQIHKQSINGVKMAWRIDKSVVRGEIDSRRKGCVTGRIWLAGRAEPLELELQGNPLRDLAGCRLTFDNPNPGPGQPVDLTPQQRGIVGDMTASRKVRVFDVPVKEALAMSKIGIKPPEHLANSLYLEWYGDANGRVVIESADFRLSITEPAWKMSAQEQKEQCRANASAIGRWLERLSNAIDADQQRKEIETSPGKPQDFPPRRTDPAKEDEAGEERTWKPEDDAPMDEFAWEKFLKAADARTDRYMELLDRFKDVDKESRERLIARAMGWTQMEAYLKARDNGDLGEDNLAPDDIDELPELKPNPLTEGIDWIRTADGEICHPLAHKAFRMVLDLSQDCQKQGLLDEKENNPVQNMIFSVQTLGAKLAGALNSLAYDHETEDGFVVAYLKRALKYLHETIKHCELVQQRRLIAPELLDRFHRNLFSIREEILRLMEQHRKT